MNRGTERKKIFSRGTFFLVVFATALAVLSCSFDYGAGTGSEETRPDIVMENIEYVRVRGGDPLVRFRAEHAERWEDRNIMELKQFTFEQMEDGGETINASGSAGTAVAQLGSGDISLGSGVKIDIESEDIEINTATLEWNDKEKLLTGGEKNRVDIQRPDGTNFSGRGFSANARERTWIFLDEIRGTYVEEDDDDTEEDGGAEAQETSEDSGGKSESDAVGVPAPSASREPPLTEEQPVSRPAEEK